MATNVFGNAVTGGSRSERALAALNDPNADGKRTQALAYVRQLKTNWGNGVSTLAIFYNATGETMTFFQEDSWYGKPESSYPTRVQNGQWGAFFHVKTNAAASGSVGFVVYRVRFNDTEFCNPLVAWSTPWGASNNQAYCDVFDDGRVDAPNEVYRKMMAIDSRQHAVFKKSLMVTARIEQGTSPVYEAEYTREDVALKKSTLRIAAYQQAVDDHVAVAADQQAADDDHVAVAEA